MSAYDSVGNTVEATRSFYADFTNPSLTNIKIPAKEVLGQKDGYIVISDLTPTFQGNISDNLLPYKVEITFSKQNFFLGIETSRTVLLTESYLLPNDNNETGLNFIFNLPNQIEYGKLHASVVGIDKAGNRSEETG